MTSGDQRVAVGGGPREKGTAVADTALTDTALTDTGLTDTGLTDTDLTDAELRARLTAAGLRATRPRLAVYRALADLGGHRSADEVAAALAQRDGVPPARASVYNTLEALVEAGLVLPADTGPGRARYEVGSRWHHHFVCRRCGQVTDVPCAVGAKPCLHPSVDVGEVDEAQVIYRGVCPACLADGGTST